jgi:thiosulfate reductase / polysulfide reductase chain A
MTGNFATLPYGILNDKPYPVKTALVRGYNPLSFPDHLKMIEAFKKLDFILTVEILPSEMAWLSDIVLPEPLWLESTGMGPRNYHSLYPMIATRNAVVPQMYPEAKGYGSIIMDLAEAMGYGEYFNDTSEGGSGKISGGKYNNLRMQALGSSWSALQNSPNGLWQPADPADREFKPREEFGTPSGKIEFYSTLFEENGYDPLPNWAPRRSEISEEYPFYLVISRAPMHKMTQTQNNVMALDAYPENAAVMNANTAQEMGIADGDEVYVESPAKAKLSVKLN